MAGAPAGNGKGINRHSCVPERTMGMCWNPGAGLRETPRGQWNLRAEDADSKRIFPLPGELSCARCEYPLAQGAASSQLTRGAIHAKAWI